MLALLFLIGSFVHAEQIVHTCGCVDWQITVSMDERSGLTHVIADGDQTISFRTRLNPDHLNNELREGISVRSLDQPHQILHLRVDGAKGKLEFRGKNYDLTCESN